MKIDKEKFNKLKQLDRIEFRQKLGVIEKTYSVSFSVGFMLTLIIIGLLCILISMNIYQMGGEERSVQMFEVGFLMFKVSIIYFFLEIILVFVCSLIELKMKKELAEEYFVVEVKK